MLRVGLVLHPSAGLLPGGRVDLPLKPQELVELLPKHCAGGSPSPAERDGTPDADGQVVPG